MKNEKYIFFSISFYIIIVFNEYNVSSLYFILILLLIFIVTKIFINNKKATKMRIKSSSLSFKLMTVLILFVFFISYVKSWKGIRRFQFINNCKQTVWVGGMGVPQISNTGW